MFPLTAIIGTLLTAMAVQLTYLRLNGLPPQFHFQMILSGIYLTALTLLIRVMDEFKDYEDDKKNFPHRPLPSGKVLHQDLHYLGFACVALILLVSLSSLKIFLWSIACLGFAFLMLKWFFIEEKMRKSLPLAFLSHHPIVLFNFTYLLLGIHVAYPELPWTKAKLILPLCLIFTNWEFARKIRAPKQETAYTTYSKIWGPRVAITLSLLLQASFTLAGWFIFSEIGLPLFFKALFVFVLTILSAASWKFLFTLELNANLKALAEGQILVVIGFLIAGSFL
jgi:4-hydroxybenzoate polyprenyltransferase